MAGGTGLVIGATSHATGLRFILWIFFLQALEQLQS
jgi:hypothetical protein